MFVGVIGSQAQGLATEKSDTDYKKVFIQPNSEILSNRYNPVIKISKDYEAYELRKFLDLLAKGNPNALELLFLPKDKWVESSPQWEILYNIRNTFITKQCFGSFVGYAKSQLAKASGLNKKSRWKEDRIVRKSYLDFCKIVDKKGKIFNLTDFLKSVDSSLISTSGFVSLDGFRDCYKLYLKNGQGLGEGNQPKLSIIPKDSIEDFEGIVYWNREEYSTHCREYREYETWLQHRNEDRYVIQNSHKQTFDSKNIMHMVRLLIQAYGIIDENTIKVDMSDHREYLLSIKYGKINLKEIVDSFSDKIEELEKKFKSIDLPDKVDEDFLHELELKLRNYGRD